MRRETTKNVVIARVHEVDENDNPIDLSYEVEVNAEFGDDAEIFRECQRQTGKPNLVLVSVRKPLTNISTADLYAMMMLIERKAEKYVSVHNTFPPMGSYMDKLDALRARIDSEIKSRIDDLI